MKKALNMEVQNVIRGKGAISAEIIIMMPVVPVHIGRVSIMAVRSVRHMKFMYVIYVVKIIGEVAVRTVKEHGMMKDIVNLIN